jgi:hypothetical protein
VRSPLGILPAAAHLELFVVAANSSSAFVATAGENHRIAFGIDEEPELCMQDTSALTQHADPDFKPAVARSQASISSRRLCSAFAGVPNRASSVATSPDFSQGVSASGL